MKHTDASEAASKKDGNKSFSSISLKSFITVVTILCAVLAISGLLSYLIPQGSFERDQNGIIIKDSYVQGEISGIPV